MTNPENVLKHKIKKGDPPLPGCGKPKGPMLKTLLQKIMDREITVTEAGRERKLTRSEAMLLKLASIALGPKERVTEKYDKKGNVTEKSVVPGEDTANVIKAMNTIMDRLEGKPDINVNATMLPDFTQKVSRDESEL